MNESEYVLYRNKLEKKERVFDIYRDDILSIYPVNNGKIYGSSLFDVLEEKYDTLLYHIKDSTNDKVSIIQLVV